MDIMGIASGFSAQALQNVQTSASVGMMSKAMEADGDLMDILFQDVGADASAKSMELSVQPYLGSMFDSSV